MARPLVSIVILTWNSRDVVEDAVRSSLAQTVDSTEVVVIDNASSDGTLAHLTSMFHDDVRLVSLDRNYGFTGGYNRALRLTDSEFVLVLNPDARLKSDYLEHALRAFEDPRVGIVSGKLVRDDGVTIDSTGQFLARSRATLDRGYGRASDRKTDRSGPILSACGAAAMYRREMIEDIADAQDFFDSDYFAFHEDLEVGWRAWRAGWKAVYVPEAVAVHLRSSGEETGGLGLTMKRSPEVTAHIIKNRWLTSLRHDRVFSMALDLPFILVREAKVLGAITLLRPKVWAQLAAHRLAFTRALEKRRMDKTREGVWGRWSRSVPRRGTW